MWTVDEAATNEVLTVTAEATAGECEVLMLHNGLRHLPVVDAEAKPIGLASDTRVLALVRRDLTDSSVLAVSEPVQVMVPRDTKLLPLLGKMLAASQGAALLTTDGKLSGIFTEHDAVRIAETALTLNAKVGDFAQGGVELYTVPLGSPAYVPRLLMLEHGIRHVLVTTAKGRLAGVISHRDLSGLEDSIIDDRLSAVVHQVSPDDDLHKAISLMVRHKIGAVAVVDGDGAPTGVITRTDVIRALWQQLGEQVD